jgi:hypothetical protein
MMSGVLVRGCVCMLAAFGAGGHAVVALCVAGDVPSIISSKAGLKYVGQDVDALRAVAKAYQDRSLKEFQVSQQGGKWGKGRGSQDRQA